MPPARKFKKMRGGGDLYMSGIDINGISKFAATDIPGASLWVKAVEPMCIYKTIDEYTKNLSMTIANNIRAQYADSLSNKVIVAVNSPVPTSQPNSIIRLEVDLTSKARFPKFVSNPEELDVISIQDLIDPTNPKQRKEKLSTKYALRVSPDLDPTIFSISSNIDITYNKNIDYLLISVSDLTKTDTSFSEIIVYSRPLTEEETDRVQGYIAYMKNEQYLLKLDHKYLPSIQSLPSLKSISAQIVDMEISFINELKRFDGAVEKYRNEIPDAEILTRAPPLKEKAIASQKQLSVIRQAFVKGGLYSRKKKNDSMESVFDSINTLQIYSEPFTKEVFDKKLTDLRIVMNELDAYMASLGNIDSDVVVATTKKSEVTQIQQRAAAQSMDALENTRDATESKKFYQGLREKMNDMNTAGTARYNGMYSSFSTKLASDKKDNFDYYNDITTTSWNALDSVYNNLKRQFAEGPDNWLTYDPSIDTTNKVLKRGSDAYNTQYTNQYLNRLQSLFEHIRNQMEEGDIVFLKNEIDYHAATVGKLYEKVKNKLVTPLSIKMFSAYCRKRLEQVIAYDAAFKKLYAILNDAATTLLDTLRKNKEYKTSSAINKEFPIPIVYIYADSTKDVYIRQPNKHDYSLSMIEYIVTNSDGTIAFADDGDCEFVFPSLENIVAKDGSFLKVSTFRDENGKQLTKKYIILKPYTKAEGILDTIPKTQALSKFFHKVNGLFEIPRDAENSIYEMSIDSPQMPILLPRYAVTDGAYFICVNVGDLPFHIQIPGTAEDMLDLLGPNEVCMYIYTGSKDSKSSYYGRRPWIQNRIAYDTLYNTPRTAACSKITELSAMIYMQTATMPLFDLNGNLVLAEPDANGIVYDIDDVHHSNPYKVTVGTELKLSELEIHPEWNEQIIPAHKPEKLFIMGEDITGLPIFCSAKGIPAINEFGYTKYLRTPALQINDTIKTRSAGADPVEITFNTETPIKQYGLLWDKNLFKKVYRSKFVKPFTQNGGTTFIFVNSAGFPLVSASNNYIEMGNYNFNPPISVEYSDNLVKETAYVPEQSSLFVPSKTVLVAKPYPMEYVKEDSPEDIRRAVGIISYRYDTSSAYIQYTITKLQEELAICKTLQANFSDIDDTIDLLNKCLGEIQGSQAEFKSYDTNITAINARKLLMDNSTDERLAMSTFDLKMKNTLEKVYRSFTIGMKAVLFFRNLMGRIEKIRERALHLRKVVSPENDKSIRSLQTVIQNESIHSGTPADKELTALLSSCTQKKLEFDGALTTVEGNMNKIPKFLEEISGWIDSQTVLIKNANALRREISEMEVSHSVDIFTKKISNKFADVLEKLQANVAKADELIKYKIAVSKWLGIYTDADAMRKYTEDVPVLFPNKEFKGYFLSFPVFEEMTNPLVSRDWYTIAESNIMSDAIRLRVSVGLVDPIKKFTDKFKAYYTNYDIRAYDNIDKNNIRETDTAKILDASTKKTEAYILEAIGNEGSLGDIFEFYKKIRGDLATEVQPVLNTQATDILQKWTDCKGIQTAIQTELQLFEPYLDDTTNIQANKITADTDTLFSECPVSSIEDIQRSSKQADYYANMNHLKMIEIHHSRIKILHSLNKLLVDLRPIQDSLQDLEAEILTKLRRTIETKRAALSENLTQMKENAAGSAAESKKIADTVQPAVDAALSKNPADIPGCIELLKEINAVPMSNS
jgi:hypothetical protein